MSSSLTDFLGELVEMKLGGGGDEKMKRELVKLQREWMEYVGGKMTVGLGRQDFDRWKEVMTDPARSDEMSAMMDARVMCDEGWMEQVREGFRDKYLRRSADE